MQRRPLQSRFGFGFSYDPEKIEPLKRYCSFVELVPLKTLGSSTTTEEFDEDGRSSTTTIGGVAEVGLQVVGGVPAPFGKIGGKQEQQVGNYSKSGTRRGVTEQTAKAISDGTVKGASERNMIREVKNFTGPLRPKHRRQTDIGM